MTSEKSKNRHNEIFVKFVVVDRMEKVEKSISIINDSKEDLSYRKRLQYRGLQIGSKFYVAAKPDEGKDIDQYRVVEIINGIPDWASPELIKKYKQKK